MSRKQSFDLPYIGIDQSGSFPMLIGSQGECSAILRMTNPVMCYAASSAAYDEFHQLMMSIVKVLGAGYSLQKQDIISRSVYPKKQANDYLQQKYHDHFAGRHFVRASTYLTITLRTKKGAFYVYDPKKLLDFQQIVFKVIDILKAANTEPLLLQEKEINQLILRLLAMNFEEPCISLDNMRPTDTELQLSGRAIRSITLVDTDHIDLPAEVGTHTALHGKDSLQGFPVDCLSFLFQVPDMDVILFNQVISIPDQVMTLKKLELKKKRHTGIPDPANLLCVQDIDLLLHDVARDNQLLVNCHFNIVLGAASESLQRATNFIESALFRLGIVPSKNAYNQLELFRSALPGNAAELKDYDWFLTTCEAALCFFLKESMPIDEPSDFLIRFTDRQGIPIGIDPADLPMRTGRINNRNKFVLGPSGSGKSFFMNALVEQYMRYNMDIVIVDVGHSYSGLCTYYSGKYITYEEQRPITMNPFAISEAEYNLEKKGFLTTLIGLLWKGSDGQLSIVEQDAIVGLISAYYSCFFQKKAEDGYVVDRLDFNSFYEYALVKIPRIKAEDHIPFDLDEFRYVLKKFYRGGEYQSILNEAADLSLFEQRFIVYEIDNVKDNKVLFPIVTLIIMDVFIQKMRHRKGQRKALILEEAWKAITSPLMAGFILYLNKTARKFWGEIIEVTQELSDVVGNPIIKDSIISNSDTIVLLDQSRFKEDYEEVASLLSISDTERRKIFTINQLDNTAGRARFKEFYMRRGLTGEVYGNEVSLFQYLTFTTEKPEKSAVESYVNRYGSYPLGLDAFVKDFRQSGLSLSSFINQVNQSS